MPTDVLMPPLEVFAPDAAADVAPSAPARPRASRVVVRVLIGLLVFLVVGNGLIMASTLWFRWTAPAATASAQGIDHLRQVDDRVLRGAAPTAEGLRDLAAMGVTTVVDLRAESDAHAHERLLADLGMVRYRLPVRDGQVPTPEQAQAFLDIVGSSPGTVFLHCGAGVGRTGAMTAFYLNATGQTDGTGALRQNLAVGPPSLEQIVFSVRTADGDYRRPGVGVTVLSRVLDGPRRIWHNLT